MYGWANGFDMSTYTGVVYDDGISAMIDFIKESEQEVVLLAIAPCPNLMVALDRDPSIVNNSRIVAMGGSIKTGYNHLPPASMEYNIA